MPAEYLHQFDGKQIDVEVLSFCGYGVLSFGLFHNHLYQFKKIEPRSIAPTLGYPFHRDCREGFKHSIGWFAIRVTGKFNPMAVFANSNIPSRNGVGDLQSEPDVLRLRSIPALSQVFRHWGGGRVLGGIMRADRVEVSWDADKSNWLVRIKSGEEVIRRHCKLPKDADEQSLRTAAQQVVHDEGYELAAAELVIRR
jgi:hypothetical protein